MQMARRHSVTQLTSFARDLLVAAGCDQDKPRLIAEVLVEADLLGHTTHGLQLLPAYMEELKAGTMARIGDVNIVSDRGAAVTWDGGMLPGVWLTRRAVDLAVERARQMGLCAIAVRRSHHIGCLAAYLMRATDHRMMIMIASSDPAVSSVVPHGGTRGVFAPNPLAVGIPTDGEPILIDMSSSITTNGLTNRLRREGRCFPGQWAITSNGEPTDDPNALFTDPPGALLPTGGVDHGHKGYGMALTIEALTQGLSGFGRAEKPTGWGAGVFVQVFDPTAFGGVDNFIRETACVAAACRMSPPAPGNKPVRLPGEQGLALKRDALERGLRIYPGILEALHPWAERLGVSMPGRGHTV